MIAVVILVICTLILWKMPLRSLNRYDMLVAWSLKLFGSVMFVLVYSHYYGGGTLTADPQTFLDQSRILRDVARESPVDYLRFLFGFEDNFLVHKYLHQTSHWSSGDLTLINDSKNVIRVNSIIWFFSGGDPFVHSIVHSFLSLLGFRELYLAFDRHVEKKRLFWFGIIAFPSLLFWTAGFLKEPLMIAGLCILIRAVFGELSPRQKIWRLVLGLFLLLAFKTYVLLCILPLLIWYFSTGNLRRRWRYISLIALPLIVFGCLALFPQKKQQLTDYLTRKQFDFMNIGRGGLYAYADTCFFYFRPDQLENIDFSRSPWIVLKSPVMAKQMKTGHASPFRDVVLYPNQKPWFNYYNTQGCESYVNMTEIKGSFPQLMKNIPEAIGTAMFRPFFGDPGDVLKYAAIIETLLLFGAFFFSLKNWKYLPQELEFKMVALLGFAVVLFVLVGWITPVLGAVVRYRIPSYLVIGLTTLILLFRKHKAAEHD